MSEIMTGAKSTTRSAMWVAAFTVVAFPLMIGFGLAAGDTPFARAMADDHPVRILLTLGFVLATVWVMCEFALPSRVRRLQSRWWTGAFAIHITAVVVFLGLEIMDKNAFEHRTGDVVRAASFVLPIIFLVSMAFLPFLRALKREDLELSQWGWLISVLVMLLAMFAFCIELESGGHLRIKWAEVPAILIVFLLVEAGATLVALSRQTEDATREAAASARDVSGKIDEAKNALERTGADAEQTINLLGKWVRNYKQLSEAAIDGSLAAAEALGRPDDVWKTLLTFARSWQPQGAVTAETRRMLGELFVQFVGNNVVDGTVRSSETSVACITADAVFAEASERWLNEMAAGGGKMVVWALTTLLPTEFAIPSAYRGAGVMDAMRVRSLHKFTTAVMRCCEQQDVEYRRITVFEQAKAAMLERLHRGANSLPCMLDSWYVLDERVSRRVRPAGFDQAKNAGIVAAQGAGQVTFCDEMSEAVLKQVFSRRLAIIDDGDLRPEIFPFFSQEPSGLWSFSLTPADQFRMALLASSDRRWESPELRRKMTDYGWQTLREWYCSNLHCTPNLSDQGAWWVALNESSTDLIADFSLEWDSTSVTTLDLLLIGLREASGDMRWHGAAISNLSFDRTECTVQMVTSENRLKKIGESVSMLCNGFSKEAPTVDASMVESFGMWSDWPKPVATKIHQSKMPMSFPVAIARPGET
jgi:hypothetical protein